LDVKFA